MNQLIRQVNQILATTRRKNLATQRARKADIYQKIPKIRAIDIEMARLTQDAVSMLAEQPKRADAMAKKVAQLGKQLNATKRDLLVANGFAADYLAPIYSCRDCRDEGFLDDGSRCRCFDNQLMRLAYQHSDLRAKLHHENFDAFKLERFSDQTVDGQPLSQRANMAEIAESAWRFIASFDVANGDNMLFYGNTGQGKTFLCSSIAKALIDRNKHVIYQTAYQLFDAIKAHKFGQYNDERRLQYELLKTCDLLIIDDLATELINSFTQSELFQLINSRLLNQKKTIISTNLSPTELFEQYGERIMSRVIGHFAIYHFYGPDLRFQ